jgi:methanogenic corrinoid protein MtbC1
MDAKLESAENLLSIGHAVEELRRTHPDVSHSSLRFLEREGLIRATRTPGGQRLYSTADIERIRQIKVWQGQRLSLEEIRERFDRLERLPEPAAISKTFLEHALAGRRSAAIDAVLGADDAGLPISRIFGEVLAPALAELGTRWEHGTIFVAQEKETSEITRDLVAQLTMRHGRPGSYSPVLVAACVEGERHELGLRMVTGLLLQAGYRVHYLGADVAPRFLLESVRLHQPEIVLLSARLVLNLPAIKDAIDVLRHGLPEARVPVIIVGGQAAVEQPETLRAWGAIPVGSTDFDALFQMLAEVSAAGDR